jgi:hypothetical protein
MKQSHTLYCRITPMSLIFFGGILVMDLTLAIRAASALEHRYSFTLNANDSVGTAHGVLCGNADISDGTVVFDGVNSYVDLPNNLVTGYTSITLKAWVMDNGSQSWAWIFDFGNSTGGEDFSLGSGTSGTQYMFLTAPSGSGTLRGAYTVGGGGSAEQIVEWPGQSLPVGVWKHVVWTLDNAILTSRLYVDGIQVGINTGVTLTPGAMGPTVNNWLGRSQYNDPLFYGAISEFRIYNAALSEKEILRNLGLGPDVAEVQGPVTVTSQPQDQTVDELKSAFFSVGFNGTAPITIQWFKNNQAIPGATNESCQIAAAALVDDGAVFKAILGNTVSNQTYSVSSTNAVLHINADLVPPMLARVSSLDSQSVLVEFSEPVWSDTATRIENYSLTNAQGALTILSAAMGSAASTVILTTSPQALGATYTLAVQGICDQSAAGNRIALNTQFTFLATGYLLNDLGQPALPGALALASGGYDLTAGGLGLVGANDQGSYAYQLKDGDFDVCVRLASFSLRGADAQAGLMARETPTSNSVFAAALAPPSLGGAYFASRTTATAAVSMQGAFPVNYPYLWLRLRRAGSVFAGYASYDGKTWALLGSQTLNLPQTVCLGLFVSSRNPTQTVVAQFRDLGPTPEGAVVSSVELPWEPLGPCNRKSGLAISEMMYKPAARSDGKRLEYIELFNSNPFPEDISGYRLSGDVDFTFPPGTVLPGGCFVVVAQSPADMQSVYGISQVIGPYLGSLKDAGTIRLHNRLDAILLEIPYASQPPWPVAPDGYGHSLVLARPSYGEGNPKAWDRSDVIGGSPGQPEAYRPSPLRSVVINEFLACTDLPEGDYLELYNRGTQPVDLSGCILTDHPDTNKFVIPAGTVIRANGFLRFTETTLGFALKAEGETICMKDPSATQVIDIVRFGAQAKDVATGRYPDGAPAFHELTRPTPDAENAPPLIRDIVINEIMYHPISEQRDDEYVELYNQGTNSVHVGQWRLNGDIDFNIPPETMIPAGGYLVIAANKSRLLTHYAGLNATNTVGDFRGNLPNGGGGIRLEMPDDIVSTNHDGVVATNRIHLVRDEVTYGDGGSWGQWADGGGSSLELIDPHSDHHLASNWADSDETAKAPWTPVEFSGRLDLGCTAYAADSIHLLLQGIGECCVDDVQVLNASGNNVVSNSNFTAGINGWLFQGAHKPSHWEASGGLANSAGLHVVALDRGDQGANKIRGAFTANVAANTTATIRAQVRWLKGHPEMLLRLHGNYLEAVARMTVPLNLGTPGARNSRAIANAGPAIYEVSHQPVLPAAFQPVTVKAQVHDPDGIARVVLKYRIEPSANYVTVTMTHSGAGYYAGQIPGQAAGALAIFSIQATDDAATPVTTQFPTQAPTRVCLARFGEAQPFGSFGTYRLWMTQATLNEWTSRNKLDNTPLDVTFVYGNSRIIYNAGALYAGSPFLSPQYSSPIGSGCGYTVELPKDEEFLGTTSLTLDFPNSRWFTDNTEIHQGEQMAFWMAEQIGIQYVYRRFINLYVNGQRRLKIYEDCMQPGSESLREWYPNDAEGDFYKSDDGFEFNDAATDFSRDNGDIGASLENFLTTGGVKKIARYRWHWKKRAVQGSVNDYTSLLQLVDAMNISDSNTYTTQVEALVDVDQWMRAFAIEHVVGNWDSYGYRRGKNMYAYKPQNGKWEMVMWDIDIVFQDSGLAIYAPDNGSFLNEPVLRRMYKHPPFARAYYRALKDVVDGPMLSANLYPFMDARYNAMIASSITVASPQAGKQWMDARRSYILGQLASVAASFAIANNGGNTFTTNQNFVRLTGTAPVEVKTIRVNAIEYPVTWTSITGWSLMIALHPGANPLTLQGFDWRDQPLSSATDVITVNYTGSSDSPVGSLVINEIMYHPSTPDADYIEIYNASAQRAFDLSNWRLDGVDFTFPEGTVIQPGGYTVIVKDLAVFTATYGSAATVAGVFPGRLDNGGETLRLIKPGATPDPDLIVDEVTYDDDTPWPALADGQGPSLQLIDPAQDHNRVANWGVVTTNTVLEPQWQWVSATGVAGNNALYLYLDSAGDVYIDELILVAGNAPGVGPNLISNGDFETALTDGWTVSANLSQSQISAVKKHAGNSSLHLVSSSAGTTRDSSIWQNVTSINTGTTYTLSFWYLPGASGNNLTIRFSGRWISSTRSVQPPPVATLQYTPGAANANRGVLPAFPPLWLNEVAPENLSGLPDQTGHSGPWIELFYAGTTAMSLEGYYLTDNYTNLIPWAFPSNTVIQPGQHWVVWVDGDANESSATELHTDFRLASTHGTVALVRRQNGQPVVFDYLNYSNVPSDYSYGDYPDGQRKGRQVFYRVTPSAPNDNTAPPVTVFINEWMANNTHTLADPADGQFEDWFELFNPGTNAVDLSGFTLTDNLTNTAQWVIPNGTIIPPQGFLLVWADGETGQNGQTNSADLHANFRLSQTGEAIGLFARDGRQVDAVQFGPQPSDISQGRWPDGNPGTHYLTLASPTPRAANASSPELRITSVQLTASQLVLTWASESGKKYQLQYQDTLGASDWIDYIEVTATGPTTTLTLSVDLSLQRYFRLKR